jgi:hypothetical protein
MLATHAQDSSTADNSYPLLNFGIVQTVISYVGSGHHLYVAVVNRRWKELYASLEKQLTVNDEYGQRTVTCSSQRTLHSSVFASPSRVQLAHNCGIRCRSAAYHRAAGKHANIATLATAHEVGMEYTAATMAAAAHSNKLADVQHLHTEGCSWPELLLERAAGNRQYELVRWCYEHGCPWDTTKAAYHAAKSGNIEQLQEDVMGAAALQGHAAMCEFLRAQRCPWDARSTSLAAMGGHVDLYTYVTG